MAYIGNTVQNQGFAPAIDYFNGNGVTVTFTLSRPIASVAQVIVAVDNVIQNPSSAFGVVGNSITFTSAPLSGTNNIWVEYTSLITTYQGISQDPTVIGDIRATGGYLAEGDFGNSFVDGTVVDYVTGRGRITVGELDDITLYHGGTTGRSAMMDLYYAGGAKIYGTTALTIPVGTTGQRPTGAFGMIRANSTTGYIEYWDASTSSWIGLGAFTATGGTVTTSGSYTYHTFTSSGTFQVIAGSKTCEYLVIAGGGGGGGSGSSGSGPRGGGGAGGVLNGSFSAAAGSYSITVGGGGAGGAPEVNGVNGQNSVLGAIATAIGGGFGSGYGAGATPLGGNGGSGGGGAYTLTRASGTSGQGNSGGVAFSGNTTGAGGGGGAGAQGGDAPSLDAAGNGGAGTNTYSTWASATSTGASGFYAGGGGAGNYPSGTANYGSGGSGGGGGGGGGGTRAPIAGTANTGGGGGGSGSSSQNGANGGSGIVIVRYLT